MHKFSDKCGSEWKIEIDLGAVFELQERQQLDLFGLAEGEPKLITRLHTDRRLLFDTIWFLVAAQADHHGVKGREEWLRRLTGPAANQAYCAFFGELALFFRQSGDEHLAAIVDRHVEMVQKAIVANCREVDTLAAEIVSRMETLAANSRRQALDELDALLETAGPGTRSGSGPVSAASFAAPTSSP